MDVTAMRKLDTLQAVWLCWSYIDRFIGRIWFRSEWCTEEEQNWTPWTFDLFWTETFLFTKKEIRYIAIHVYIISVLSYQVHRHGRKYEKKFNLCQNVINKQLTFLDLCSCEALEHEEIKSQRVWTREEERGKKRKCLCTERHDKRMRKCLSQEARTQQQV